jgi:hypothetical protein
MSRPLSVGPCSLLAISLLACGSAPDDPDQVGVDTQATGWADEVPAPSSGCIVDGQLQRPLWVMDQAAATVVLHEPGGVTLELAAPGSGGPRGVDVGPSHVAITNPGTEEEGSLARLYDRHTGELIWERSYPSRSLYGPRVAADGQVAVSYFDHASPRSQPDGSLVITHAGDELDLVGFQALARVGPSGWVPGLFLDLDDLSSDLRLTGWGWRSADFGSALTLAHGIFAPNGFRVHGEYIEYLDYDFEPHPRLLRAAPTGSAWIELEGLDSMYVRAANDGYRLLFDASDPQRMGRIQTIDGEVLVFDRPLAPAGYERLECADFNVAIDGRGRVLFVVRDASVARIAAWDPKSEETALIGAPMSEITGVEFFDALGRYQQLFAYANESLSCDHVAWEAPPDGALLGESIQLIDVDSGEGMAVSGSLLIDPSRVCATWPDWTLADTRVIYDLEDGDMITLPGNTIHVGWVE